MKIIYKSQLPKPEAEVRADLNNWILQKEAHKQTVGIPAPFPEYELLNILSVDFVVVNDNEELPEESKTIEELKQLKNAQINKWRAEANLSFFPYEDKLIATDRLARSDIDGVASYVALFNALPPNFPGAWKTIDNSYVLIPDVGAFKALVAAMVTQGNTNFLKSQQLKEQIASAKTEAEITAIQWEEL